MPNFVAETLLELLFLSVIISSAITTSAADDPNYEACQPKRCGNGPNISYPFYFVNTQEHYCGATSHGFAVNCINDEFPVLNISGNHYEILNISYTNRSIDVRLWNNASDSVCPPDYITNTTLPEYFGYANHIQDLYLVSECRGVLAYWFHGCHYLALLPTRQKSIGVARTNCSEIVLVPVEDNGGGGGVVNALEYLANGIRLNWTASDCAPCENSGGRCGYNTSTLHFECFCRDQPHSRTCHDQVIVPVLMVIVAAVALIIWKLYKRRALKNKGSTSLQIKASTNDLPFEFGFNKIMGSTNGFSEANKLGRGGFGTVYKGKLEDEREIAVKRLSKTSTQGEMEFKNEAIILAKLQHRNLVRLVGYSIQESERLLIYEYYKNGSLDRYIFDLVKKSQIKWDMRYKIIMGIARGLMYLHDDSRVRIIHRDMKLSNILLDDQWNPRIADFGIARLCRSDDTEADTMRIVGTHGYMAPEYVYFGKISPKTDVFSFGVLILEIISGLKANLSFNEETQEGLLYFAWKKWKEGSAHILIDNVLIDTSGSLQEILRCIHIGMLCIQPNPNDRPKMASILHMLSTSSLSIPQPNRPPFAAVYMEEFSRGTTGMTELEWQVEREENDEKGFTTVTR